MSTERTGIARKTSHAPCVNFVIVTTTSTSIVKHAPSPLIASPVMASWRRVCRPLSTPRQWRTMPSWPSENDTNTPMMYSWMSVVRFAW